jgi:hypothetical protein
MFSGPYYLPKSYHPYGSHTYGEIGGQDGYLANLRTFAGHSMHGGWEHDGKGHRLFSVYSAGTRIAYCYDGEQPSVSVGKYSPTTTRHQGLCRAWLGHARLARLSSLRPDSRTTGR